jgi:hypothetical protein
VEIRDGRSAGLETVRGEGEPRIKKARRGAIGFGALLKALLTVMPGESAADSAALEKGRKLYEEIECEKAIPALLAPAVNPDNS